MLAPLIISPQSVSPIPDASFGHLAPCSWVRGMHSVTHISPTQCRKPRVGWWTEHDREAVRKRSVLRHTTA